MNNLMMFGKQRVEVFEFYDKVLFNPYHVGACLELTDSAVRKAINKMNKNQVVKLTKSIVKNFPNLDVPTAGRNYLTESGVYKLVFRSNKKEAENFTDWVTDEVLPTIRKTGKYEVKNHQLSITPPYEIKKKTYNGIPVMVMRDLEYITGKGYQTIYDFIVRNGFDIKVLNGVTLKDFKNENKDIDMSCVNGLIILEKEVVSSILEFYKVESDDIVKNYFQFELKPEKLSAIENFNRYEKVMVCADILDMVKTRPMYESTRRALTKDATKILVDMGLYDVVDDSYSLDEQGGWNKVSIIKSVKQLMKMGRDITRFEIEQYKRDVIACIGLV